MNHSNFGGPYPHPDDERQWGNLLQGLFGFGNWGNQPPFGPPGQGGRPPGPPFGPPSGGPGRPPFGPPPGQGGDGPPSSPPPSFITDPATGECICCRSWWHKRMPLPLYVCLVE